MKYGLIFVLLFGFCGAKAEGLFEKQFLTFGEAENIWNMEPFDSAKFKAAKPEDRAGMALDIINHGIFNNKRLADVKRALGEPDSKFEVRYSLAYDLGSDDKNSYRLIFLPDFNGKNVENIKISHQSLSEMAKPSTSAPTTITSESKRIPINIDGALAESLYKLMRMSETKSNKTGKNIACSHLKGVYHCSLEINEKGEAVPGR